MKETVMLEVLHVILETMCSNIKNIFSNFIEHVFFEILEPKVKHIAIEIFYRPPNEKFQQIDKQFPSN